MLQRSCKFFLPSLCILFIGLLSLFLLPHSTLAQLSTTSASSVSVDVVPTNPAPFDNVTITLSSYAYDLDTVMISWVVNGKKVLSGMGQKSFSLQAPAAGASSNVEADLSFADGPIAKIISIKPAVMELLWQAEDSYVPPFYEGKAMPSLGSDIKVVAMPEIKNNGGGLINPGSLTYNWQQDYTNQQDASGYGKNYFTYTNDYLETGNNISVTASTVDGASSSDANLTISATQPKISFYRSDKNLGTLWQQSLSDPYIINSGDITLVAIPYFISPKYLQIPSLVFNWTINGDSVNVLNFQKNILPLKVQSGTSGTSKIHLDIENQDKIYQSTNGDIDIQF